MKDFEVFNENWNWKTFMAHSAEDAAEKAGEYYDTSGDYYLSEDESNSINFAVRLLGSPKVRWFKVNATHSVHYGAEETSFLDVDSYTLKSFKEENPAC